MSNALEEQEIQALCHKFGVPDLILKWLGETKEFHAANEYILHEDICNLHPEDALLCISLCICIIDKAYDQEKVISDKLRILSGEVIANYGHNALHRSHQSKRNDERLDIEFVAKDLTVLTNELERLENEIYDDEHPALSPVISALSIQAGAQAEIARYVLSNFREQEKKNKEFDPDIVPFLKTLPVNDNTRAR